MNEQVLVYLLLDHSMRIPAEGKARAARAVRVKRTCVGEGPPLAPATCHPRYTILGNLLP